MAVVLSGHEGSDRCGLAGAAFPGQESADTKLRKGSDNQHGVGVSMWQEMQ